MACWQARKYVIFGSAFLRPLEHVLKSQLSYLNWNGLGQVFLLIMLAERSSSEMPHLDISVSAYTENRCPKCACLWKLSILSSLCRISMLLEPSSKLEDLVVSRLRFLLNSQVRLSALSSLRVLLGLRLWSIDSDLLSQLFSMPRPGNSRFFPLKATCRISLSLGRETLLFLSEGWAP